MSGESINGMVAWPVPLLADVPLLGHALFQHDPVVYLAMLLVPFAWWFVHRSRAGLRLAAAGHDPAAAHRLGLPVLRVQLAAIVAGGALAGIAGAWLAVAYTPLWSESISAGRGWIALALVVFATWRPARVLLGAYLFGGMLIAQLFVQGSGIDWQIPSQWLSALPYLTTIIVLVLISRRPELIRLNSPASLGQPYRPDA
jgi:simple sugar transport system permease protein